MEKTRLLCTIGLLVTAALPAMAETTRQQALVVPDGPGAAALHYWQYLPEGYEQGAERWPLMLFLHGAGERGQDLAWVKVYGPPKMIDRGKDFPCIVLSPQCPAETWWRVEDLVKLLDHAEKTLRVDPRRIMVTGLSMGGFGTWALAAKQPRRFAALAPICGGGNPEGAASISHIPVWVFHGAKDSTVPVERSREMVEALKAAGGVPRYTEYPEIGHPAWNPAYNNPELFAWMLKQKLAQPEPDKN